MSSAPENLQVLSLGSGYGIVLGGGFGRNMHRTGIVSAWTWSATLLVSTTVAFSDGVSGGWWYGSAATLQLFLFCIVALKLKSLAPGAHTFLEIVNARYGSLGHAVYGFYAFATCAIVSASILNGGVYAVNQLTGMSTTAASFLIPFTLGIYVFVGGLRSTFALDYIHTAIIYIISLVFMFNTYASASSTNPVGSIDRMYDLLVEAGRNRPIVENKDGSYLTFRSFNGIAFFLSSVSSGCAGVFLDQGYWQRAIASKSGTTTTAFMIGGFMWFSIPLSWATSYGLAAAALYGSSVFPGINHMLTPDQLGGGLPALGSAIAIQGNSGAAWILVPCYMAVTSAVSSEIVALSSLFTFDLFKTYFRPQATNHELVLVEKGAVLAISILIGAWNLALLKAGVNLTFLYFLQGTLLGGCAIPVVLLTTWSRLPRWGALLAPAIAPVVAIPTWIGVASIYEGAINVETLAAVKPALAGTLSSLGTGAVVALASGIFFPVHYDWAETLNIQIYTAEEPVTVAEDAEKLPVDKSEGSKSKGDGAATSVKEAEDPPNNPLPDPHLRRNMRRAIAFGLANTIWTIGFGLILLMTGYVFNRPFFRFYIVIVFIWLLVAAMTCIFMPIIESRKELLLIARQICGYQPARAVYVIARAGSARDNAQKIIRPEPIKTPRMQRVVELTRHCPENGLLPRQPPLSRLEDVIQDNSRQGQLVSERSEMVGVQTNGLKSTGGPPSSYSPSPELQLRVPSRTSTPNGALTPIKQTHTDEGYRKYVFSGKKNQALEVEKLVIEKGFIPEQLVHNEVAWFFTSLGIDDQYFALESIETIASHIISLYGSKILAYTKSEDKLVIQLEKETEDTAVYINTSEPGVSDKTGPQHEQMCARLSDIFITFATTHSLDARFLDGSTPEKAYRIETYRSSGNVSSSLSQQLRCYFVFRCHFVNPNPAPGERDIKVVSDKTFLEKVSENTLEIYQSVMSSALERTGPVVECYEVEGSREHRLVIGFRQGSTTGFFAALSDLYHWYGIYSTRKYVEQFSNGITIISCYLNPLRGPPIESSIFQVMREASLVYCLPNNPFFSDTSGHAVQEATYAYCAWVFAQHFLNRLGSQFSALRNLLDENNAAQAAVLSDIRKKLREETFTRQSILEVIQRYPDLIRMLYVQFAMTHHVSGATQLMPTLSYQRLQTAAILSDDELYIKVKRTVTDKHDLQVFESIFVFNRSILKTNFYQNTKVAISFRLDPSFLPVTEYPKKPFGLFFVIGSEFRGFHLRFKDVARGGIRIIRSRNREAYSINQRNLFDENYGLASTQALKNKDIPEGGAKGVILPDVNATPRIAFEKYVDSILDLLIKGHTPGIKDEIVDLLRDEEILFFGPDEGTADMMDWAALHARARGAPWWKSFTTGKSAEKLGGVPHDAFGMTSLSVRQYVVGIYRSLGLKETEVKKVQTGGPDGDLGSNEILLSKDKTIAIIDGSGVLHEPEGIDREELTRLARERKMISHFDSSKLSKDGYRVLVEDVDITLPHGEVIPDGQEFRNTAHLRYKADLLVPCGGRPEAVNISNVSQLWDDEGKPNFKYIVEGANLFITQQARLALEKKGVVLFKDASANKGGVTSSSLEVLAGLSLDDEAFIELMTSQNADGFSDFYLDYVKDIQNTIIKNAAAEFNCIWKESQTVKKPRAVLTDEIGALLITLQDELERSTLYDNKVVRTAVLAKAFPQTLLNQVGLDKLIERLPDKYLHSLFSSYVAAHYVYKYGPRASQVDFFSFLQSFQEPLTATAAAPVTVS